MVAEKRNKEDFAVAILGGDSGGGAAKPEAEGDAVAVGLEAAMTALGAALEAKDYAGAAAAFKDAHNICAGYSEE